MVFQNISANGFLTANFRLKAHNVPDPATGTQIFKSMWLLEEGEEVTRDIPKPEHFHRLFISFGYATRRMPCLKIDKCVPCGVAEDRARVPSWRLYYRFQTTLDIPV
ncbi:hypothetical protein BJY01DRAFT_249603 [Aspergillus pseudoustus]|uniref:Uncharacterized protein n=1 Tax=Aspergillus pseudoustus TaxID=1810923 RepID=A0ABR4JMI5_9EURO